MKFDYDLVNGTQIICRKCFVIGQIIYSLLWKILPTNLNTEILEMLTPARMTRNLTLHMKYLNILDLFWYFVAIQLVKATKSILFSSIFHGLNRFCDWCTKWLEILFLLLTLQICLGASMALTSETQMKRINNFFGPTVFINHVSDL